jgi:EAL domain-containing protein (putative c-di-GMP-specific phosphodiesterase class I)
MPLSQTLPSCGACGDATSLGFEITFAFQPIVNVRTGQVFSQEALVRGPAGEGAPAILQKVHDGNRYKFDQVCRTTAIGLAKRLNVDTHLNINFLPNAVYQPEMCIRSTIAAAKRHDFPIENIIFEVSEAESLTNIDHLVSIFREYQRLGFKTAIDDFGAGYAGLTMLAAFQPDFLKIDMKLVRDVHASHARQAIVRGILAMCRDLDVTVVAEGVESAEEATWLLGAGIDLLQGFYFARPAFEALAPVSLETFREKQTAA